MDLRQFAIAVLFLVSMLAHPESARAAQSYDNCAGIITTLPTTISTQGVWCMQKDLATAITSGNAITIATNNVTIDCNDFKLGGLAAGNSSQAYGIFGVTRQNVTIRHCNIRGFNEGVRLEYGSGNLVEDNRFDNNLYIGIYVGGDNNLVQHNRIYDTGGASGIDFSFGIAASADIRDNTVSGLFADKSGGYLFGVKLSGSAGRVRGNRISGFDTSTADGGAVVGVFGIKADSGSSPNMFEDNAIFGPGGVGVGIEGDYPWTSFCKGNVVQGFATNINACRTDTDNGGADSNMTW